MRRAVTSAVIHPMEEAPMKFPPPRAVRAAAWALCVGLVAGCGKETAPPPARPPVDVTVVSVAARDTPVSFEFIGQTQSSREVEIRARVDGFLEKRLYAEGDLVHEGQPLFQIDRKPFEASLQSAQGQLSQQQAALEVAIANLNRVKPLAEQDALSKKDLDDAIGNEQKSRAAVLAAQGQVQQAQLNLGYTTVYAPLTGLSSFAKLQEGTYLSSTNNLLTYVAQLNPIWVNFSISENEILRYRDEGQRGMLTTPKDNNFDVEVVLADGTHYPYKGRISFTDPSFSKDTGTFLVRAVLSNPKSQLRPGQFVRVLVQGATRPNSILVPQRAVQQGARSHFVWVVGKENKAEQRVVEVGAWDGDDWFITQGLRAGEQVVVDGAIRVAPGAALKTTPYAAKVAGADARQAAAPMAMETDQDRSKAVAVEPAPAQSGPPRSTAPVSALSLKVYFDPDSDVLSRDDGDALAPIGRNLAGNPAAKIDITGYADRTGARARNVQLAKDRAKAVRAALIGLGAAPGQTILKPPTDVTGGGDDRQARRVDVAPSKP
jgi:membrane fusion protein (multidrug efflux system)